ncbi:M20 metallopeptidase family protein [Suicoccus acidiformans]|nr:amidohydrolase [Suicoccus acidiformans]
MEQYYDYLIEQRRFLHQIPELAFQEFKTHAHILKEVQSLAHAEISQPTPTSLVVDFKSAKPGLRIGLRADIDGLPIQELARDQGFKSQHPGQMHACGHDVHAATLLACCRYLSEHFADIEGEIRCIFQHAEEVAQGGGKALVEAGVLDGLDILYAMHVDPTLPSGQIDIKAGANTTNTYTYTIEIEGQGGHAAKPHEANHPLTSVLAICQGIQAIAANHIPPQEVAVITNTVVQMGDLQAPNIIPQIAYLAGSIRTFEDQVTQQVIDALELLVKGVCQARQMSHQLNIIYDCPSVMNDPEVTNYVRALAQEVFTQEQVVERPPSMVGEDFAYMSRRVPACFVWLGIYNEICGAVYPLHHPKFTVDEAALAKGLDLMLRVALNKGSFLS